MGDFSEEEGRGKESGSEWVVTGFRLVKIVFQMLQNEIMTNEGSTQKLKCLPEWSSLQIQPV